MCLKKRISQSLTKQHDECTQMSFGLDNTFRRFHLHRVTPSTKLMSETNSFASNEPRPSKTDS